MRLSYEYIAGLIDGEGCLYVHRGWDLSRSFNSPNYYPGLLIAMCGPQELALALKAEFGGSVSFHRSENGWRPIWQWRITGRKAIMHCLKLISPYLIVKRQEAEILLRFCNHVNRPGVRLSEEEIAFRENCYLELREAKRLVPDMGMLHSVSGKEINVA
jgi:hypothetical protein